MWAFVVGTLGTVFPAGRYQSVPWEPTAWAFVGSALIHSLPAVIGTDGTAGSDDSCCDSW